MEIEMFRKLLALEVAALASNDDNANRQDRPETDMISSMREAFMPRSGNHGSMWSRRSFS